MEGQNMHTWRTLFLLVCYCLYYVKSDTSEDARLNFTQLAVKYGHKCEEFDVVTEDNYILKLFHIKGDETKPILLGHGNLDSADAFILRGKESLASFLAEKGYDVWALNTRGTKYGRRHKTLNPDTDKAFWDFSFHEWGLKDLPANIDVVLKKTNQTQLTYISHSQGTQMSFVLTSIRPEYNAKIKVCIAMAPIAFMQNMLFPSSLFPVIWPTLEKFFPEEITVSESFRAFCSQKEIGYKVCVEGLLFSNLGADPEELEPDFAPIVFGHYPTSTSNKNLDHISQLGNRKKFAQYDYGLKNQKIYGQSQPPDYPLKNITSPVVLLVGRIDKVGNIEDVKLLKAQLPNAYYHEMERETMNHIDFTLGKNMKDYLFPVVNDFLQKFT